MYESTFIPWLYDGEPRSVKNDKLPTLESVKRTGQGDVMAPKTVGVLGGSTEISDTIPKFKEDVVSKIGVTNNGNAPVKKKKTMVAEPVPMQFPIRTPDGIVLPILAPESMIRLGLIGQPMSPYDAYLRGGQ